jgi:hypothetical protein
MDPVSVRLTALRERTLAGRRSSSTSWLFAQRRSCLRIEASTVADIPLDIVKRVCGGC